MTKILANPKNIIVVVVLSFCICSTYNVEALVIRKDQGYDEAIVTDEEFEDSYEKQARFKKGY